MPAQECEFLRSSSQRVFAKSIYTLPRLHPFTMRRRSFMYLKRKTFTILAHCQLHRSRLSPCQANQAAEAQQGGSRHVRVGIRDLTERSKRSKRSKQHQVQGSSCIMTSVMPAAHKNTSNQFHLARAKPPWGSHGSVTASRFHTNRRGNATNASAG